MTDIFAHEQKITHSYTVHYPDHAPRIDDPHYAAFETFRRRKEGTPEWVCAVGKRFNDFSQCANDKPLEVHHKIIEYAVQNAIDLKALQLDFPEIQTEEEIAAFVESDANFEILCAAHHRGHGGVHTASAADWEAEQYVKGLIS